MPDIIGEASIISPGLASQYELHMAKIQEASNNVQTFNVQLWTSIVEIFRKRLWKARWQNQEEWFAYLQDIGIYGTSRASLMKKCNTAIGLINSGASPEKASEMVAARAGAAEHLAVSPAVFSAASGEQTPDEYIDDLLSLPSAGEAIGKVNDDLGNKVAMWIGDVIAAPDMSQILAGLHRSDSDGYHTYDVLIRVLRQRQESPPITAIIPWLVSKVKSVGRFKESKERG